MIEFLTETLEILKLIAQIVILVGCLLILLAIPFIAYYCPQKPDETPRMVLRIKINKR
jgi:hypothetical protein